MKNATKKKQGSVKSPKSSESAESTQPPVSLSCPLCPDESFQKPTPGQSATRFVQHLRKKHGFGQREINSYLAWRAGADSKYQYKSEYSTYFFYGLAATGEMADVVMQVAMAVAFSPAVVADKKSQKGSWQPKRKNVWTTLKTAARNAAARMQANGP